MENSIFTKLNLAKKYFSDPVISNFYKWLNDLYKKLSSTSIQSQVEECKSKIQEVEKYVQDYVQCTYLSKL